MSIRIAAKCAPNIRELELVRKAGWKYLEVYTNREYLGQDYLENLLRFKNDLKFVVHAPEDYCDESVIEFAHRLGAKVVVVHYFPDFEKNIQGLLDFAESKGIFICLENGVAGVRLPITPRDFDVLKKRFPKIRFTIDIEHSIMAGIFPGILEKLNNDIKHIHLTGYPPNFHSPPLENSDVARETFRVLKKINYDGFVVAEMDQKYQTEEIFRKTREFLEEELKKS